MKNLHNTSRLISLRNLRNLPTTVKLLLMVIGTVITSLAYMTTFYLALTAVLYMLGYRH